MATLRAGATRFCEGCGVLLPTSAQGGYCSAACHQLALRTHCATPPRAHLTYGETGCAVYYCPGCEARYLGVDYCDTCGRFCRPLGLGGLCPCCATPVAIPDLVGREITVTFTL
jgi:hypothetical protein